MDLSNLAILPTVKEELAKLTGRSKIKLASSNSSFVKLPYEIKSKWKPFNPFDMPPVWYDCWSVLSELETTERGWKYVVWRGTTCEKVDIQPYNVLMYHYQHRILFQHKDDALMFKLRFNV